MAHAASRRYVKNNASNLRPTAAELAAGATPGFQMATAPEGSAVGQYTRLSNNFLLGTYVCRLSMHACIHVCMHTCMHAPVHTQMAGGNKNIACKQPPAWVILAVCCKCLPLTMGQLVSTPGVNCSAILGTTLIPTWRLTTARRDT